MGRWKPIQNSLESFIKAYRQKHFFLEADFDGWMKSIFYGKPYQDFLDNFVWASAKSLVHWASLNTHKQVLW